jgi:hypothetical protein
VSVGKTVLGLTLQIGAHTRNLQDVPGPWSRWPLPVVVYTLSSESRISTPFGGLVYLMQEEPEMTGGGRAFSVQFSEVGRCPFFTVKNKKSWKKTRDHDCPHAEIECKTIVFTLPSNNIRLIPAIEDSVAMIDEIVDLINAGLSVPVTAAQYRVVFDVQDPGTPLLGYPLVLGMSWMPIIFESTNPTAEMFNFFAMIAVLAIPQGIFSPCFTGMLAALVGQYAFMKKWPRFVMRFPNLDNSPLWGTMISTFRKSGIDPFTYAMLRVRAKHASLAENVDAFVNDLAMKSKNKLNGMVELMMETADDNRSALEVVIGNS